MSCFRAEQICTAEDPQMIARFWYNPGTEDRVSFDKACATVKEALGSYESIAQALSVKTGRSCTAATVRRWFMQRTLDVSWASTLIDLCREEGREAPALADFYPWLKRYC
jgi:hypothetical protein